jgi:hypothetical protein
VVLVVVAVAVCWCCCCCGLLSFVVVVIVVVACGGGERRVAGCSCGGCFLWVSCGAMYSMHWIEIVWPVGIVGKRAVVSGSRKLRV